MFARPRRELIRAGRDANRTPVSSSSTTTPRSPGQPYWRPRRRAGELQLLVSATAWWRERKGDVAKGRQARYRRSIADSETRHPPGNCGQRSVAVFRDGFRWQLIGTERNKEARHELISDRDLDHRCSCRRRTRRLAGQRGAGGAQVAPGTRARGTAPRDSPGRNARRHRPQRGTATRRAGGPLGGPCRGHASPGRGRSRRCGIQGTPGRARGARWIGNNGTGPLVPATGRVSAAAGGKS